MKQRIFLTSADALAVVYVAATVVGIGVWGWSIWSFWIPTLLFVALIADGVFRPGSSLFFPTVTHGPRDRKQVALSFDDGPDSEVTPGVLDALAKFGARATFFTIGRSLAAQPQIAQRLIAEGHELGNHSWRHSRWQNFFGTGEQRREIERGAQAIAATGDDGASPLYRPPMGFKSRPLARVATEYGLTVVAWSLHGRDTIAPNADRIAKRVLRKIRPGDIVLLHDGHDAPGMHRPECVRAVQLILQGLRERSLQCVTISELLGRLGTHAPGEVSS